VYCLLSFVMSVSRIGLQLFLLFVEINCLDSFANAVFCTFKS